MVLCNNIESWWNHSYNKTCLRFVSKYHSYRRRIDNILYPFVGLHISVSNLDLQWTKIRSIITIFINKGMCICGVPYCILCHEVYNLYKVRKNKSVKPHARLLVNVVIWDIHIIPKGVYNFKKRKKKQLQWNSDFIILNNNIFLYT